MDDNYSSLDFQQFSNLLTSMAACGRMRYWRLLFRIFDDERQFRNCTAKPKDKRISIRPVPHDDPHEFAKSDSSDISSSSFSSSSYSKAAEFVRLCLNVRDENDKKSEKEMEEMLWELYHNRGFVCALMWLLRNADTKTIKQFADSYLGQGMAVYANVDIVVRRNDGLERMTGNIGRYIIFTRMGKDDVERLLKFTNQASTVYYLMFLISRCQQDCPTFVELRKNRDSFLELYRQVYDEPDSTLVYKYTNLLQREDKNGVKHAGRLHEIIFDIRKHLAYRFEDYDETFLPYAMTARQHLTVSADHIYFEGEARQLLNLEFV